MNLGSAVVRLRGLSGNVAKRGGEAIQRLLAAPAARRLAGTRAGVCFVVSGGPEQLYQARQWLWSLERLAEATAIDLGGVQLLARHPVVARSLANETTLPVVYAKTTRAVANVLGEGTLVALYPNQATLNFQALAARRPAHVHLSHGESEKVSMISNQLKAYDEVFTAGQAARERLSRHLIGFDQGHCRDVGRPQLDEPRVPPHELAPTTSRTVLYAPTWEGDSPSMAYSSLAPAGINIVDQLLAAGRRVIYRPHPQTGTRDRATSLADAAIVRRLREAGPEHLVDRGPELGWQWDAADECVLDLSAMAYDALTTDKPLVVYRPGRQAGVEAGGLLDHVTTLSGNAAGVVREALVEASGPERRAATAKLARYHFGAADHGSSIVRFIDATRAVATERSAALLAQAAARRTGEEN
ncbi:CDP-glycerol--glycerophosphate glycerophosphotransferase [Galactobacter valiniphilus]|uniref:CDP-glycerol--glycerophosphate glycerophosphotransferase n=1 Tax=Galactobacter valiniphilus TaxID=2676122 RepID=A0A399JH26_9MICC|nr:CDP-glycerol--glycerophosphate glycerophosphotransferase [Galactobacter valiniphilus]RII41766.1 CDP-glycerol--glycerophosphate glycerophosphotransferase [Galactobacter valiniphilus]